MTAPESFKAWPDTSGTPGSLHGAKATLKPGDLIQAGRSSNCGQGKNAAFVYLTGTLDATTWGAELAIGDGPGRNYIVAPMGPIEDSPNLTDKKFPGNPARSSARGHRASSASSPPSGSRARTAPGDEGRARAARSAGRRSHQRVTVIPRR